MNSIKRWPEGRDDTATQSSPDNEQSRLDDAIRRADDLLVSSLQRDENQRRRRKFRVALAVAGAAMLATLGLVSWFLIKSAAKDAPPRPGQLDAGSAAVAGDANQLTQQGWDLFQKQQYDQAVADFDQAVKINPKLTAAWNGLGWSQFNSGKSDDAEKSFKHVIALEPKYPAALNGLGQLYFARNQLDKAEPYLLKAAPSAPAAWWGLAKLYLLQSKWDNATVYLQKIVDSDQAAGSDLEQVNLMLDAAHNQNLPDSLKKQISPIYGSSAVAQTVQQGWAAMNHGDTVKARTLFDQALAADPKNANALNGMGWLLLRTGKLDEAKSAFEAALKNDPEAAGSMNGLALIDRQQGRLNDAIAMWEQMLKKFPGVNAGTYGLADAYMAKNEYDKAVPLYEQIVKANPADQDVQAKLDKAKKLAASL